MIKVFIAGPYSADNIIEILNNIRRGQEMAYRVMRLGFAPYCPWLDYQLALQGAGINVFDFQKVTLEWLYVSDVILMLSGWENSKGATRERDWAIANKKPVFENITDLISCAVSMGI